MKTSSPGPNTTIRSLRPLSAPARLGMLLHQAMSAHAQRRRLAQLDDSALNDIGVSRLEADAEAARPVWDVPANWRR